MNCKINSSQITNVHVKTALNRAKVMGITGTIISLNKDHNDCSVLFTHDSDGNQKNQIFPMPTGWLLLVS